MGERPDIDLTRPSADHAGQPRRYRDAVPPGSHLVVSHATRNGQHTDLYRRRTATPMTIRSKAEVEALFEGYDLVEPGVVHLPLWRPASPDDVDAHPERVAGLAAVGRKR